MKNTNGGVLLLVFTKSNTPPWVFFTFFKLYKWYQRGQRFTYSIVEFKIMKLVEMVKFLSGYGMNWVIRQSEFSKILGLIFLILSRKVYLWTE